MSIVIEMNPIDLMADPLFDIELKVARRADELSRDEGSKAKNALELWCQAEREVLQSPAVNDVPLVAGSLVAQVQG